MEFGIYNTPKKGANFTDKLIKLRGHRCERCNNAEWLQHPIKLEVHHIDGDKCNCLESNLQLLCPNCHSYTDNYGIKNLKQDFVSDDMILRTIPQKTNIRQVLLELGMSDAGANYQRIKNLLSEHNDVKFADIERNTCQVCGSAISNDAHYCVVCSQQKRRITNRPERDELKFLIRNTTFVSIGQKYGVSDNAIRKWCDYYNLPKTKSQIKKFTNEEWDKL